MRLNHVMQRASLVDPSSPSNLPVLGFCRCFLCGHDSRLLLPLDIDQTNWVECEECGLDNEVPAGTLAGPLVVGRVPTRLF
jgi:hypothetical protein